MKDQEHVDLAQRVVEMARAAGADQAEAWISTGREFSVRVRDGEIEDITQATSKGLSLSVYKGQRLGSSSTTDFTASALETAVDQAVAMARETTEDKNHGLPDPDDLARRNPLLDVYDPAVEELSAEWKIEQALQMERIVRAFDPRIVNIDEVSAGDTVEGAAFANSLGIKDFYRSTSIWLSCSPMAKQGEDQQVGWYYSNEAFKGQLKSAREVAEEAARRTLAMLGADKIESGEMPVVFHSDISKSFIRDVVRALDGDSVYKGASFLGDKLGQKLGPEQFTLVDDPTLPRRVGSLPFDSDGVATRRNVLFDAGAPGMFIYDVYTARKAGTRTTGNSRGGSIGAHQLCLNKGDVPREKLFEGMERGLYVTRLMGGQANPVNGDYSRGAMGTLIERGKLARPVQEITLAGNMIEMLASIDAVGDDFEWLGSSGSPSIRFRKLAVSGR